MTVREALADYLLIRRQVGFKLKADQRILENFVSFLEQAGAERITTELALRWARLPAGAHPYRWRQRLGIVRGFARYLATLTSRLVKLQGGLVLHAIVDTDAAANAQPPADRSNVRSIA